MSELPSARTVGGTPLARHLICLAVCLAALGIVALRFAGLRKRTETPPAPLEVSLWYWHSPFRLEAKECDLLRALNIRSLYVRAGTIERGENGVTAVLPQTWEQIGPNAPAVHLVFNFDYSMVRHFSELDNATIAGVVAGAAKQARSRAEAAGLRVIGVQMDFDCATKRLPKYADLLRKIRTALASPDLQLSITALETWYENGDLSGVLDGIDFAVPQYYEANLPASIAHFSPVSDFKAAARGLERAERFGKPFYAGLPAYGHALMTDETGKILGLYREMTADNATRHPAFQFVRAFPANANGQPAQNSQNSIGENLADFVAIRNARDGRGKGYHLIYDLPTPLLLARHLALIRANRPSHCRGVILFRYPEPGATMTLPLPAIAAALQNQTAQPDLKVKIQSAASPWELIETGRSAKRPPLDVAVSVTNCGNSDTFFAPDGLTLTLTFDRLGLSEPVSSAFDRMETFAVFDTAEIRASPNRANTLKLAKWRLAPNETARIALRLPADGATILRGTWALRNPDGLTTRTGTIYANLSTN